MNDKYTELRAMVKAMTEEERTVVLENIPFDEILLHLSGRYAKLQDTVNKIEAITREGSLL